jgi:hypothetical protein
MTPMKVLENANSSDNPIVSHSGYLLKPAEGYTDVEEDESRKSHADGENGNHGTSHKNDLGLSRLWVDVSLQMTG